MPLPKTMKAVVVHGIEDYRLEERPVPQVGPGEVLVRIRATGVCASDVKTYYGADRVWGSEQIEPYIETPVTPPPTMPDKTGNYPLPLPGITKLL